MTPDEPREDPGEEARFRRLLAERLPRHAAPAHLRAAIAALAAPPRRAFWWAPALSALATAMVLVLAALPRVMEQTGIGLSWLFQGDDEIQLINAEPLVVEGRRALALTYQDTEGHTLTYTLLPGAGMPLPKQGRVKTDGYQPLLTQIEGWSIFAWKQKDLACFLISDLVSEQDLARFKQVFLKVRQGTEPPPQS